MHDSPLPATETPEELTDTAHLKLTAAVASVFERLRSAVWVFDIERKRMHWANGPALRVWNSDSLEQLLGRDYASDMSRSTETRLLDYLARFRRGESVADRWTFYPKGSPTPVTVVSQASGIRLEDGRMAMLFEASTVEIDAVESEKLRMIEVLRHTSILIAVLSAEGKVILQNPASLRARGSLDVDDESGFDVLAATFHEPEALRRAVQRALEGEEVNFNARVETLVGPAWHEVKVCAVRDPVTRQSCILINEANIDQLRRAQERNLQLERDATEKRMAGGFAHEVRNALSGAKLTLQGALGLREGDGRTLNQHSVEQLQRIHELVSAEISPLTQDGVLNAMASIHDNAERLDQTLRMASSAVERTLELTSTIMRISRAGHEKRGDTPVDVAVLLEDLLDTMRAECQSLGVALRLEPPLKPALVRARPEHLRSIFLNLLRNAKDALCEPASRGRPDRRVLVRVEERGLAVRVEIHDNGVGVPRALRDKIFEPFFTTKLEQGTGLGLGLARKYIDLYAGKIELESEPGSHTCFTVTLPARPADEGEGRHG